MLYVVEHELGVEYVVGKWQHGILRRAKADPSVYLCTVFMWCLETSWPILSTVTATWLGWENGSGRKEL